MIVDNAVTSADLADNIEVENLYADNVFATTQVKVGSTITITPTALDIPVGAISDEAVVTADLANDAVTTVKIADDQVTLAKLENLATKRIMIGQGTGADVAAYELSGDVTMTAAGVVTIAENAVTTAKTDNAVLTTGRKADAVAIDTTGIKIASVSFPVTFNDPPRVVAVLANPDNVSAVAYVVWVYDITTSGFTLYADVVTASATSGHNADIIWFASLE